MVQHVRLASWKKNHTLFADFSSRLLRVGWFGSHLFFPLFFPHQLKEKKKAKEKAGHCGEMLFNDGVVLPWVPCV